MIRLALALSFALAASTSSAAAGLPEHGVLVPGKSLAGVHLGDTASAVRARWGTRFRACHRCAERTWYHTFGRRPEWA